MCVIVEAMGGASIGHTKICDSQHREGAGGGHEGGDIYFGSEGLTACMYWTH